MTPFVTVIMLFFEMMGVYLFQVLPIIPAIAVVLKALQGLGKPVKQLILGYTPRR